MKLYKHPKFGRKEVIKADKFTNFPILRFLTTTSKKKKKRNLIISQFKDILSIKTSFIYLISISMHGHDR